MSEPTCSVCGGAAACGSDLLHASADDSRRASFSIFPVVHDHHEPGVQQPPSGSLHEFQFFGQDDHESVAWLFDDPPPSINDDQPPVEDQPHNKRSSMFDDPFGQQYHPGNGLTFEVSLGLGGGARHKEIAASATIVSSVGSKESLTLSPGIEFCLSFVFMCLSTVASFLCLITIFFFWWRFLASS